MGALVLEHVARAPVEVVFALASDFARAPENVPAIRRVEMLTPGPVGRGTRFRETRVMFGKEATAVLEVLELEPPRRYVLGCEEHGCRYRTELSFEPRGELTLMRMRFEVEPLTRVARVVALLMKPMMRGLAKSCAKDLEAIAGVAERVAPAR